MEKEDAETFFSDCPDIYRKLSILDEPTTELHFKDIENLLIIFRKLVMSNIPQSLIVLVRVVIVSRSSMKSIYKRTHPNTEFVYCI